MRPAIALAGLLAVLVLTAADPSAGRAPIVRRPSTDASAARSGDAGVLDAGDGSLPPPPLPPKMAGAYHLKREDELDALNLELADTFWRFTLCGCDASRDRQGPVKVDGAKVHLLPPPGKTDFPWLGLAQPVHDVVVALAPDLSLKVSGKSGEAPFQQKLSRGRICAVCNLADFPGFKPDPDLMEGMLILSGPRGLTTCPGPVPANPCDPR
ncbi:MAG TPA: hypothetical protein VGK67_30665 [Myxococcales bacterium]|jgi:hypothetical protein